LILKTSGILLAYHNLPQETAQRIKDGWYIPATSAGATPRVFIISSAAPTTCSSAAARIFSLIEIETLLERHPAVHQAVVLPFDHEMKGQVPYAFLELRAGRTVTESDIKSFALANAPAYQHPRRVFLVNRMPLAGTNKIDRALLRQWVADGTLKAA
jgi:acyl-CoA synthetase (AMP-forming)/AMP-acid ligase II